MNGFEVMTCSCCGCAVPYKADSRFAARVAAGLTTCSACRNPDPVIDPKVIEREERQLAAAYRRGARRGLV